VYIFVFVGIFVFFDSNNVRSTDANVPESYRSKSDDEEEEILGSDDDEQEDPQDYCKGKIVQGTFLKVDGDQLFNQ